MSRRPRSLPKWFYLLRYHRPSQFFWRVVARVRNWTIKKRHGGGFAKLPQETPQLRTGVSFAAWCARQLENCPFAGRAARIAHLLEGRFTFLHEERALGIPVDWRVSRDRGVDLLWKFHLHYHEFLADLASESATSGRSDLALHAWNLVLDWIDNNPISSAAAFGDAWHPFCISKRIPVWILLWAVAPPSADLAQNVLRSLAQQTYFLEATLERDVGGNHLLENARGLALAGAFFSGPAADRWLAVSRRILSTELPRQILPHGEHFERSPMYHAQMLDALLDVAGAVESIDSEWGKSLRSDAKRMGEFLRDILHPDGEIPLLADSALDEIPAPVKLLKQAGIHREYATGAARIGDYWTWRDGGHFLLFDAGPVGADHLPAHAHSDLLTLEASIAGRRFIVDTGVFGYRDDDRRRICRSTAAHNVLQIDGVEQCDTWSRFRMGYRGNPSALRTGETRGFHWALATHDAYRRIGIPQTGRMVACRPDGLWLILDRIDGTGHHEGCSRLFMSPEVTVQNFDGSTLRLTVESVSVTVRAIDEAFFQVENAMIYPSFGIQRPTQVLTQRRSITNSSAMGWKIAVGEVAQSLESLEYLTNISWFRTR